MPPRNGFATRDSPYFLLDMNVAAPSLPAMEEHQPQPSEGTPQYEPPAVTDYGSLTELTAASATGTVTDHSFPAGTPAGDITFS